MYPQKLFRRTAASQYIWDTWGVSYAPSTLAKLAVVGGGPPFRRVGRFPVYSKDDLDDWVRSKLSVPMRSTSEYEAARPTRRSIGGSESPELVRTDRMDEEAAS
jgi:hypothetical protein